MSKLVHKTWLEVDKQNIVNNINQLKKIIGSKVKFMAVVKSNAYGHGLQEIGKIASRNGADWLGVDYLDEAIKLRQAGIKKPVLILGYTEKSRLQEALDNNISLIVYNKETIEAMGKIKTNKKFKVHIKIETGTSRQGIFLKNLEEFCRHIQKYNNIDIEGIATHFANIEDTADHSYAQKQLDDFNESLKITEKLSINIKNKHTACSAATILYPETYFDIVRVGISLYGLWSSKETKVLANSNNKIKQEFKKKCLANFELKPALTWKTIVAQIKNIKADTPISYGLTEKVNKNSVIAVIPVGYWDGYDRKLSSIGNVLINGKRCKILGRICMNMMVVDISEAGNVKIEDEVVLLGIQGKEEITAEEIALKVGTINYEIITRINPMLPRIVK